MNITDWRSGLRYSEFPFFEVMATGTIASLCQRILRGDMMTDTIPRTTHRTLNFDHGEAIGMSHRWHEGQYCSILTKAGIVGCGIYAMDTPAEFNQAIAIAKGTPSQPLCEPEDLYDAKIVDMTPRAASFGIEIGMTGREAVEKMLAASAKLTS